jgi:hypothetical protein
MNPLLWIFKFVFGCRHHHMSRVFTIKRRTYRVCFDCGGEFDLPKVHAPVRLGVTDNARSPANPVLRAEASAVDAVTQASPS